MIEVINVYKSFGDTQVLKNISTSFESGKMNLIIGQSGSGKTVLMKSIVGLFSIDKGNILYDGRDFANMTFKEKNIIRQELGMLFQGGALFDSFNVEENVMFPLNMFSDMTGEEKMDRINFCLKRVNLENVNHLYPS